ncbi:hypothetical protein AK812_SmicGene20949 [Symbiodinium microadriaticum]|uniref:Uncharacterized protein n=1 Tax=Symbiodinium microadriaticum TaxID=2951 RepID=A0A1Q9DNM1_SYMMI|nr:hypothetical protein AK812_SmicGene20949 [Symbiodinium microadriaticum]CAE7236920.1 unnamed protein product [Symbiodinium sp. KB8]CAE7240685.1 unnamed protein product [Symbiodinium microadriaticum]
MQFRLTCQRTFIHAESPEDEDVSTCQRRTQSAPPEDRSTERSTYVSALASRADQLHFWLRKRKQGDKEKEKEEKDFESEAQNSGDASTRADSSTSHGSQSWSLRSPSASESQSEPETFLAEFSLGSLGHPEVCHRPCVNFAKGFCAAGSSCDYCHLSHVETPLVTANKELRVILQQATEFDLLSVAVKHAWTRAADKGFLEKAKEAKVLTLLEERLQRLLEKTETSLSPKHQGKLDRFMAKMPFSGLMGLALRKSQDGSHTAMVKAAVDSLRSNLSQ